MLDLASERVRQRAEARTWEAFQLTALEGVDATGDTHLALTVNWGDASKPEQIQPGLEYFALKHKYRHKCAYTVRATWADNHGLSNSRE
jgi:hypothetical protein